MKRVGSSDLRVFPIGMGGNTFGNMSDAQKSERILDGYVAGGGNFIDTADAYSHWKAGNQGGESETILGEWMRKRGNRRSIILATKVGAHPQFKGLAPDNVQRAADASLERLQTDYIDLYYAHYDDETQSIESIARTFDALVREGKVRYVGISNVAPARISAWMHFAQENSLAVPVALQPEYSLVARKNYEHDVEPLAREYKVAVFPYFSLAAGFLSGKFRTAADLQGASRARSVQKYLTDDGLKVIDALRQVAEANDTAMATTALAWLLARPTVTAPLASATNEKQLAELLAAPALKLSSDDVEKLDAASKAFA